MDIHAAPPFHASITYRSVRCRLLGRLASTAAFIPASAEGEKKLVSMYVDLCTCAFRIGELNQSGHASLTHRKGPA